MEKSSHNSSKPILVLYPAVCLDDRANERAHMGAQSVVIAFSANLLQPNLGNFLLSIALP